MQRKKSYNALGEDEEREREDDKRRVLSSTFSTSTDIHPMDRPSCYQRCCGTPLTKLIWCLVATVIVAGGVTAGVITADQESLSSEEEWKQIRLPTTVVPELYELQIYPDLETDVFTGSVNISARVQKATKTLFLHAVAMTISRVSLAHSGATVSPVKTFFYPENEFLVLEFNEEVEEGDVVLQLQFKGNLTNSLAGLYRSTYENEAGETIKLATTQFEATDARRAFPCFDEPSFKANFSIIVTTTKDRTALSNMPVSHIVDRAEEGLRNFHFDTSVKMSTYLVAFIVCDFVSTSVTTDSGVNVSVWAPASKLSRANIARDAGAKIISYYETYFGIPYPLPKVDMVAIPDFAAGAMENWGLVTYRETALLFDPVEGSAANEQRVVVVVAHELAHQWFGNLVTMEWWDGLWLNEGFATFVEFIGTNDNNPEFDMWDQFICDTMQRALDLDATKGSHPVIQKVDTPSEIGELFDSISYSKGGSLISMLIGMVGEETFSNGVTLYLKRHMYSNANTADLWAAIGTAAKEAGQEIDVPEVMSGWTTQVGYPLLDVTEDKASRTISITQQRFLSDGSSDPDKRWKILVNGSTETNSPDRDIQMWGWVGNEQNAMLTLNYDFAVDGWMHLNLKSQGFYRVNYPQDNWDRLAKALSVQPDNKLSVRERSNVFSDAFALADAEKINITIPLECTKALTTENQFVVWDTAAQGLNRYYKAFRISADFALFKKYLYTLLDVQYKSLGWTVPKGDAHTNRLLRSLILTLVCRFDYTDARNKAKQKLAGVISNPDEVLQADIRGVVYEYGVAAGGEAEWTWMLARYRSPTVSAAEANRCLHALGATIDMSLLQRTLQYSLDSEKIRPQDATSLIGYVGANVYGQEIVWDFLRDNWDAIFKQFGQATSFSRLIESVCGSFNTRRRYDEVEAFFEDRDAGTATRGVHVALDSIQVNIRWMQRNYPDAIRWLSKS